MSTYNIGVVGVRHVGRGHIRSWAKTEGATVLAVADLDQDLCNKAGDDADVPKDKRYSDYHELLADEAIDIVSVCLPTGMHEKVVLECVEAGKHVLCEKPPASTAEQARHMADAALRAGKTLGYSLQRRGSKEIAAARDAVTGGEIGKPYFVRCGWVRPLKNVEQPNSGWRLDADRGGGSMLDLGVHLMDSAWYILGCPAPVSVAGALMSDLIPTLAKRNGEPTPSNPADDSAHAMIRFEGGLTMTVDSGLSIWRCPGEEIWLDIAATQGAVQLHPEATILHAAESDEAKPLLDPKPERRDPRLTLTADFLDAIEAGRDPIVSAEHAVTLMRILEAVATSSRTGETVRL